MALAEQRCCSPGDGRGCWLWRGSSSSPNLPALFPARMQWQCSCHHSRGNLSPITGGSLHHTEGLSQCFGTWFCFLPPPPSLVFIVKLQTFPSTSLRATTFPTLPSLETHEGSRKREVCDKQMGNRENSQTKRGMRRRREQGADSWPLG